MSKSLRLRVLTPVKTLLEVDEVAWIQVQLVDGGGLGIYPGHAPLLAEMEAAPLRYADAAGEVRSLVLDAGILQITPGGLVTCFTSSALRAEELVPAAHDDDAAHFDRLARELFAALRAQINARDLELHE